MKTALCLAATLISLPMLGGDGSTPPSPALQESKKTAKPPSIIAFNRQMYEGVKAILLRSAEKMPEDAYAFRPTESVRSFAQILGHVADTQYLFASKVLGEPYPKLQIEKTRTTNTELIAALKEAFAYCDRAHAGMTEVSAVEGAKLFAGEMPKLGILTTNNLHSVEHYGNLVTYMRMKGIVPPTSDPAFMQELTK